MKHGKKILKIGRNASHRKATLQSMSAALLEHKRITTTFGKAKALRRFVEPVITHAKDDSTHSRRQAFRKLNDKESVKRLYGEIAEAVGDRPGGYTRIVKLGQRAGDAAEMAIVELVDFNDVKPDGSTSTKRKTRRSRSRKKGNNTAPTVSAAAADTPLEDAPEETAVLEATPDAVLEDGPNPQAATPADSEGSDATTPDGQGAVEVPPHGDDHPDASQGAATETGEPGPGADAENLGRSHDNR
ncbi:MAG: 50S ribosomal protein L17 [Rubrivirga sp.]